MNYKIIFFACLIFIVVSNVIVRLRSRKYRKLKIRAGNLKYILDATNKEVFINGTYIGEQIGHSKNDFRKICKIFLQAYNRKLVIELYDLLQPDKLAALEYVLSKSKIERIAKRWLLKQVAEQIREHFKGNNNHLYKILDRLPNGSWEDLRFTYSVMYGKDLDNEIELPIQLKRLL